MAVIDYMNVVMAADTKELDAGVTRAVKDIDRVKSAANGSSIDVKGFKDVTKSTKSTAEFAGVLGQLAGESALGRLGQMVGGISEKVSQFSEISQAGSAGALAFRVGLVGLVAAGSFNIGTMIGEWWFETKRWNEELKNSSERLKYLGDATRALQDSRFKDEMKDLQLLTPSARQDEIAKLFNQSNRDLEGLTARRDAAKPGAEKNDLEEQLNALRRKRQLLWEEIDPRNHQLKLMEEAKQKEQEMANIRKSANDQLGQLAKRYDELTLGKDAARAKEMRELGLSEGAIGREMNLRKMVEEQERLAEKAKKDEEEAKQTKIRNATELANMWKRDQEQAAAVRAKTRGFDAQELQAARELARQRQFGLISSSEFTREINQLAKQYAPEKPEYRGAVSAQAGSIEAYKMLLERDKGLINESIKQTAHQEHAARLLQEIANNTKGGKTLLAAR